ncbi:unnamed protein product [Parajaminaea phylloscopi]
MVVFPILAALSLLVGLSFFSQASLAASRSRRNADRGSTPLSLGLSHDAERVLSQDPAHRKRGITSLQVALSDDFTPIASVIVGKTPHRMIVTGDSFFTVLDPVSRYHGGERTSFVHKYLTKDGDQRADRIFLDDITIGGVTAKKTAVGLANIPFMTDINKGLVNQSVVLDGFLSLAPENVKGYSIEDPSLLGFMDTLSMPVTLKYAPEWNANGGQLQIPGQDPTFWVQSVGEGDGYTVPVNIAGVDLDYVDIYTSSFLSRAPESAVRKIFESSGLTAEDEEESGSLSVVAKVNCSVGHPLTLTFADAGTIHIPGLSNMWKRDDKNGTCYSSLRSSLNAGSWLGYALFRSAYITFDGTGDGKVGFRQANGNDENVPR